MEEILKGIYMKQTPVHEAHNPDLLAMMPTTLSNVVEVGCSSGALAREYKKVNAGCQFTGIDIDPEYCQLAERYCDTVVCADVEKSDFDIRALGGKIDGWIFGDSLEHFQNPWKVLEEIRSVIPADGCIVACIPNAQHWTVQAKLNVGAFRYEESGLLDKTHLRWFTRTTIFELFESTGFKVVDGMPRIFNMNHPGLDGILNSIKSMAAALGEDPDIALEDALPLQYVVRAVPA